MEFRAQGLFSKAYLSIVQFLLFGFLSTSALHAQQAPPNEQSGQRAQAKPPSTYLNSRLPRWLQFNGEYRTRFEGLGGVAFKANSGDAYALGRLRLNTAIAPRLWMRLRLQVQDSRVRGRNANPDTPPYEGAFDLRSGYVELGSSDGQRSVIRIGRQEMAFGEERLIGGSNWTNTARTFDAVRATLQHRKLKLDVFTSSVVNTRNGTFNDRSIRSNALYGLYGSMTNTFIPGATIEPFVLWRAAKQVKTESGSVASLNRQIFGIRWLQKLPANLDYGSETAVETGSVGSDSILSWAGHWAVAETFRKSGHTPRVFLEYDFASGDRDPKDGKEGTFDQLYPSGHDKLGLSDQVGWKNIHDLRSGLGGKITGKFSVIGSYHSWWLASARDGLYNSSGNLVAKISDGSAGRYVGQEADVQAIYSLNGQTEFGSGYANIFPGNFLKHALGDKQYRFIYAAVTYAF